MSSRPNMLTSCHNNTPIPLVQSFRHMLLKSCPNFASAPPLGPRLQTRRRIGCTLVVRLRVLGYGPFSRTYIISPQNTTNIMPRQAKPTGPRTGPRARATTEHCTGIKLQTQPIATYCNLHQRTVTFSKTWFRGITFLKRRYVYSTNFLENKKQNMLIDRNNMHIVQYSLNFEKIITVLLKTRSMRLMRWRIFAHKGNYFSDF